ncbi:MAG: adenosylcobinamide-GDP ribazoletransferase [Kangiellaceae bacterium]|nr:adenosylcobinamide-GDP ribazoletransferase [Kangiellaceae bacterium]MCW9016780.1 adenosylcobinamide-GDP ribazoletransferase [Kangiellaceae bacterium]
MSFVKGQLNLFMIALGFFTRIPVPSNLDFSQNNLNRASRYFPLVGWLIGAICAFVFWVADQVFSLEVSVLLSMLASVLLTGCFHEDGLADTSDGFGGGWTTKQKLDIMKDSRVGTYGATALWFALTLKFFALTQIESVVVALLIAHPLSRGVSTALIYFLPYVTDIESSKVKPLAESNQKSDLFWGALTGLLALLFVGEFFWIVLLTISITGIISRAYLNKQIGGFSGDTLGAVQQVSELVVYLTILAIQIQLGASL